MYCVQKMPRTRELSLRSSFFVPLHLTSEPVIDLSQTVHSEYYLGYGYFTNVEVILQTHGVALVGSQS